MDFKAYLESEIQKRFEEMALAPKQKIKNSDNKIIKILEKEIDSKLNELDTENKKKMVIKVSKETNDLLTKNYPRTEVWNNFKKNMHKELDLLEKKYEKLGWDAVSVTSRDGVWTVYLEKK